MTRRRCRFIAALLAGCAALAPPLPGGAAARRITWSDAAPLHSLLRMQGIGAGSFREYVQRVNVSNRLRVRDGDLDHLVFYLLQSTHFTSLPPLEPALSAKAFVEGLRVGERDGFLREGRADAAGVPPPVRRRVSAFVAAMDSSDADPRLSYFRALAAEALLPRGQREAALLAEYVRVMRFVYQKEFVAQHSPDAGDAVARLYRRRGLSVDTGLESGYLVYLGLGVARSLYPAWRVRRVLIVGPGLDLAPRTGFAEERPLESYQPWAVMDALLALGLSRPGELEVVAADINPRVVERVAAYATRPPTLVLAPGLAEGETLTLSQDYGDYSAHLGNAIDAGRAGEMAHGAGVAGARSAGTESTRGIGIGVPHAHGGTTGIVRVRQDLARALRAELLDIVTERIDGRPFDLVIATNILPYFDDPELMLAMCNVTLMLAPGGVLLHNERRPVLHAITAALGLPFVQSRHAVIAAVRGAAPLIDNVWLHMKE